MVINVKKDRSSSSLLSVNVEPTSTIADVKNSICYIKSMRQLLKSEYHLYFEGNRLEDNLTLKDCGVESRSTLQFSKKLQLHIRMAGAFSTLSDLTLSALSSDTADATKCRVIQAKQLPYQPAEYVLRSLMGSRTLADNDLKDGSEVQFCDLSFDEIERGTRDTRIAVAFHTRGSQRCSTVRACIIGAVCLPFIPCIVIGEYCIKRYQDHHREVQTSRDATTTTGSHLIGFKSLIHLLCCSYQLTILRGVRVSA